MFANRTNPPAVGHYRPKIEVVLEKPRLPHFNPHHVTSEQAFKKKFDVAKSSVSLCPHVLKNISPRKAPIINSQKTVFESAGDATPLDQTRTINDSPEPTKGSTKNLKLNQG